MKQYIKDKPTKWGFKFWVLADSKNGYTCDFNLYAGRRENPTDNGLGYDVVMNLMQRFLDQGYCLYIDNFYSSPVLFGDLLRRDVLACGTIRENRRGFPRVQNNALAKNAVRGTIRYIRENNLVFIKWKDTRDVVMCSSFHEAASDLTVVRKVKNREGGGFTQLQIPYPPGVSDYNEYMGGVDLSDMLVQCCQVPRKTRKWYKTIFYHCLDIAAVNAFVLYKEMEVSLGHKPVPQKLFRKCIACQLVGDNSIVHLFNMEVVMAMVEPMQIPLEKLPIEMTSNKMTLTVLSQFQFRGTRIKRTEKGRKNCSFCYTGDKKEVRTPWKCLKCNTPLCLQPDRNCFKGHHDQFGWD